MSDPTAWRIGNSGNPALELHRQSQYKPPVRSPLNLALLDQFVVGDFVLEADLLQTGREYGHRDMCLIFGFQDPAHFYYVHLATTPDDHAHNIFIVNDAPRTKIANRVSNGVDWGRDSWHKVRIERTVEDGTIQVFFDDPAKPIMVATDRTFQQGYVGFGSFDDTGKIDHVRLWAPQVEKRALKFFEAKH